ncbi:MAG: filamentous hemagglutinin/adhesin [Hyphomonadaceae bacterium]|nr:MAG: filamentous hemagglutinin/adhesin [Hyphomonadaceae bacterium]KAF0184823.1 MAG: filamentous hemagglutinin/adhesin [Hyphomonadaceae bacterium]
MTLNRLAVCAAILGATLTSSTLSAQAAPRLLEIDNFIGRIEMSTSNSPNMNVVVTPGRKANATTTINGNVTRVSGSFGRVRNINCNSNNGRTIITINGVNYAPEDLPMITATSNSAHGLRIRYSYITGQIGDIGGVTLGLQGCGDLVIGNVLHDAQINMAGSGDVRVGNIGGKADINLAGSGDAQIGNVGHNLEINIAGSGNLQTGNIGGETDLNIAGSGNADIASTPKLDANVAGSGDILVRGGRGEIEAMIVGSGDINYRGTAISPKIRILGSGAVNFAKTEDEMRGGSR